MDSHPLPPAPVTDEHWPAKATFIQNDSVPKDSSTARRQAEDAVSCNQQSWRASMLKHEALHLKRRDFITLFGGAAVALRGRAATQTALLCWSTALAASVLELLKEISPGVKRVAVLREPTRLARFLAVTTKPPSPARDWWRRRPRRTDRISQRSRQLLDPIFASRSCTDGNASAFTPPRAACRRWGVP